MYSRNPQVSQYIPELNKLIEDIRSPSSYDKEMACVELKSVYLKFPEYSEEIFGKLLKIINSSDTSEKLGGLMAVDHLSMVIQETQMITFVNKFSSVVFQQFTLNTNEHVLNKTAKVFGKLVRMGGTKIAQVVEADVDEALNWLKGGDSVKEIRKLAAILALKQLLIEAPYLSFNKIFMNNESFSFIWNIVREKKPNLREVALDFLDVSIKNISQRELTLQTNWLKQIGDQIKKTKGSNDSETIHGNIIVLRSLLCYGQKDIQISGIDFCEYILNHKSNKNSFVQIAVIETIPYLAKFDTQKFCHKYIKSTIQFLLQYGLSQKFREKSICYQTLANIIDHVDRVHYKEFMPNIMKNLQTELERKSTPFCVDVIKCLEAVHKKFKKKIVDYCKFDHLCELILLNGLYPQNLKFLGEICKIDKNEAWWTDLADYIQLKLLMTISSILSGKIYRFPHRSTLDEKIINSFQNILITEITSNSDFKKIESIALSLQALATFDFSFYADSMALFVKDIVLDYLDDENPIIRKAAAKAGGLLYIRKTSSGQMTITKNLIGDILEKFLSVCLSDPDNSVRETMLESLNHNFDPFLTSQRYLKMLFTCLNDPVYKVCENSLKIICRLMRYNPAEIIPFLKKKILQVLGGLNHEIVIKEKEKIEILDLLSVMITHAPNIIKPHNDTISINIIAMLNDPNTSNTLIPSILNSLSHLSSVIKQDMLPYLKDYIPIIIQCMQDMSYSTKREVSIKTLTQIIKNTGYVILPYYKYPNLLDTVLYLMKNETNQEIRDSLLSLMGALGALDAFYYKRIRLRLSETRSTSLSLDEMLSQDFRNHFVISKKLLKANQAANKSKVDLIKFYNDLLIVSDIDRKKSSSTTISVFELQTILNAQLNFEERDYKEKFIENTYSQNPEIDELLYSHTVINLTNPEYYATVTIKALLKVLCDATLNQLHNIAVDALNFISTTLKTRFANFLGLVIPVFTHLIDNDASLRELLLHHLDKMIKLCGTNFQEQYVDPVLDLVLNYLHEHNLKLMPKCFETLVTLVQTNKRHLRHKMELITNKLNQIMVAYEDSKEIIKFVLMIYSHLGEMLDNHLQNIVQILTKIILNNTHPDPATLETIISFFNTIISACPSTLQYTSKIVQALLHLLDQFRDLQMSVINCFVTMILKFKNAFMTYLPLVNQFVIKHKINHRNFRLCVDVLLNQGSLQEIETFVDNDNKNDPFRDSLLRKGVSVNEGYQPFPVRQTENEVLLQEFNTSHRNLKEDWIEWMRKSSLELLKQNPYLVLYGCHSVAELYPPIAQELYNVAFVSCWSILNDRQKESMVKFLNNAIQHQTIPVNILQMILNLAEFMQHDREVIPIDISILGDLAERCKAYAKALYYRELEFEVSPESTIESLISLYTNLGHSEAANGLLIYARNTLNIELKMGWYENLQRWQEALNQYDQKVIEEGQDNYFVNRMRCLNALSDWEILIQQCDTMLEEQYQIPSSTQDSLILSSQSSSNLILDEGKMEERKKIIELAANAAFNLSEWEALDKYSEKIEDDNEDKNFLLAICNIRRNKLDSARTYLKQCREDLDSKVSGLLLESYSRAYDSVIRLQQILEMEEIIDYKEEEYNYLMNTDMIKEFVPEKRMAKVEELYTTNSVCKIEGVKTLKDSLIEKWNDRLNGCQYSVDVWQKILAIRSILLTRFDNMESWVKLSNMLIKNQQPQVAERTLKLVERDALKVIPDETKLPSQLQLALLDSQHALSKINTDDYIKKVDHFLETVSDEDELRSKYYRKMGKLLRKGNENFSQQQIDDIIHYYELSTKHSSESYKSWHHLGLMNFEAVEYFSSKNEKDSKESIHNHVMSCLKSFIKAISIGSTNMANSKNLQDTLRLLTLWFKYGDNSEVSKVIEGSFKSIDVVSWIQVVPQLIARFDIPNTTIQNLIHQLLIYIGRSNPQALIYPLTVSLKEKTSARKTAAVKILNDMRKNFPAIVEQVLLISDELCRAAIMLKEQWRDGIEDACRLYFQEKNTQGMIKTLLGLHEQLNNEPQTLSEIAFHQGYKLILSEAEAWLRRYTLQKDEYCIAQAWDIYQQVFKHISLAVDSLTVVHLENVSPQLLKMRNTEISVPGLYDPNKPLIKIAGFNSSLAVLSSKQHPRRLTIYGSDSKEHQFLLKGHEDTRQDERVMQLFSLVNQILASESEAKLKDLSLTRYSITPLSTSAGLLGWLQKCDTLQALIKEYRENFKIIPNTESKLLAQMCHKDDFEKMCLPNKVEIFRHVLDNTKGEDLKKVLWLKSPNSETWLERRTTYTRSLALMSMVGYILGLGDRHPSNIMLQRMTGKIVHIDFGDCFEVAMKREKFPEKIPFRLTRMLIKVMEACSIEGTYRSTCEDVMRVLRDNNDSLMAIMQAFVYDPLLNWRLLTASDARMEGMNQQSDNTSSTFVALAMNNVQNAIPLSEQPQKQGKKAAAVVQNEEQRPIEILNQRALEVVERIKKKLNGRDFKENEVLKVKDQVNQLIKQATSHENICQAYIGWCPFW